MADTQKALLEQVAKELKGIKSRLSRIERSVAADEAAEEDIERTEHEELAELEQLERLEEEIRKDVAPHPLTRITYRDVTKGIIGSFFGIVGHFAFFYGGKIAHEITLARAHALIFTSLIILVLFIYFSGFRRVRESRHHKYVPVRALTIFVVAHAVIAFVLTLFGRIEFSMGWAEIYKNIAAVSILAVMGAATADLIGGDVE